MVQKTFLFLTVLLLCVGLSQAGDYVGILGYTVDEPNISAIPTASAEVYQSGFKQQSAAPDGMWTAVEWADPGFINNGQCGAVVLSFQLPARPAGQVIDVNSFMMYIGYWYNTRLSNPGVDLYGIGYRDGATAPADVVQASDWYMGACGHGGGTSVILQHNFLLGSDGTSSPTYVAGNNNLNYWQGINDQTDTLAAGDTGADAICRMSSWLNSLYDAGAEAGDYALLRLSPATLNALYVNCNIATDVYTATPVGGTVALNMGPKLYFRFIPAASAPTCAEPYVCKVCNARPAGDVNNDCDVTIQDMPGMAAMWLECGYIPTSFCD